ncbi:aspartate carbamoyltransferase catalytic subunit [Candidatus Hakubella thermalkaliphila]|uniref:Aspartate carbamoyltransferase n=1 Tax=Candidatus Hakubella thermalkaliphila TaxID=2754717 RepID=A0A6V8P033_9ACTN|nr:aspartate carbamoyltransferase catalytic subunit [Candidatus Hakubella thermalkaliphila]
MTTAKSFVEVGEREIKKLPTLRGKTIVNLFYEPSTRTRISFELAGKRLSADIINFSEKASAAAKGESLKDTTRTLNAMNINAVVIRHPYPGSPYIVARNTRARVINAGDGCHEHPTQTLLDLFTIKKRLGYLKGLKAIIVGDIFHSRVARSNILAFKKMGMEVKVVAPPTLLPAQVEELGAECSYNLAEAVSEADIIYLLRMQTERQARAFIPSIREYVRYYGLNRTLLKKAKEDVLIMHPGPMTRGVEIESDLADIPQSTIVEQVTSGIAVRMAILYLILSGDESE